MDGATAEDTVDIDHQTPEFVADRHNRYHELRERCPVVFNQHYGGFWMVTDYESVAQVARDNETFAHKYEPDAPDGISYMGICGVPRPSYIPRQGVSEIDGPEHADLRRVLNPLMTINAVESNRPRMEAVSGWFLDEIVEAGAADLVLDYTTPVPAVLTLEMMGMVSSNWQHYADFFHATSSYEPSDERYLSAIAHQPDMWGELRDFARFRRENPADDVTSALVSSPLAGRLLSDDEITAIMWNLVAGGLDTTTSLVSWGLHHLGTHPEDRSRLVEDPSLIPAAVEEFLRHYSPSETLTRTATRDVELGGREIRRGDVVFISWVTANHDPEVFDAPDEVRFDRDVNKHLAFGLGGHRCIGSSIARIESELMLRDVLSRIGDYEIDADGFKPYPGNLLMTGVVSMPVAFTPGNRSGAIDPFV
ncbi:cytochrome P450 [Candidatus Poriferisocius sp.]|uniref:cytochrome P450 n=1 Tax=Candidatus Poriferisocius sp. TaxID=3101276 RepID=UPI003B022B70